MLGNLPNRGGGSQVASAPPQQGSTDALPPETTINEADYMQFGQSHPAADWQLTTLISLIQLGIDLSFINYNLLGLNK